MHDLYDNLTQLCETVSEELEKANDKVKSSGGKLSPSDVEYLDKLTHMIKSIKTTKAMMDAEDGYSSDMMGGSSRASYARGRGSNARRDSRGRYSSESRYDGRSYDMPYERMMDGRSYDGDMISELHELMEDAPNDRIRQKFQQFITEIERMK